MGYERPIAIIVTGRYDDPLSGGVHWAHIAHAKATEIFKAHDLARVVTAVLPVAMNRVRSFLVGWDGSEEGWEISDAGDAARSEFVTWLHEQAYEDGSSPLDWVEVQYGGDDQEALVLRHGDEAREVSV